MQSWYLRGRLPGLDLQDETITTAIGEPIGGQGAVIDHNLVLTKATI